MILERLQRFAKETPARTALRKDGAALSYRAFWGAVEETARVVREAGCEPGSLAAVLTSDRLQGWILLLGLRRAGLSTVAPDSETTLATLNPPQLRYRVRAASDGAGRGPLTFGIETLPATPTGSAAAPLEPGHILLTSATTGRPKAVLLTPRAQALRCANMRDMHGAEPDTVLGLGAFGHWTAAGYNCASTVWSAGGTVALDSGPAGGPDLWASDLTQAVATPAMLAASLAVASKRVVRSACKLRVVGAAAPWADIRAAAVRLGGGLVSELGSTEVGSICVTPLGAPEDNLWNRVHPSREVEVVDARGAVLPAGVGGMVRVRLRVDDIPGYLDDPEQTAAHFRDGCFYPGDLGVLDPRGRLSLQGRLADVVNVAGAKLPALPIERRIEQSLGVRAACVLSLSDAEGGDRLHVVVETRRTIPQSNLEALASALAPVRVLTFHFVPELPRNAMGKIDRLALQQKLIG